MLAPGAPSAEAPLRFAAGVFRAQAEMAGALRSVSPSLEEMLESLIRGAVPLLRHAEGGPAALAEAARARLDDDPETARSRLRTYWDGETDARDDYLSRAILQPWVRLLAAERRAPQRTLRPGACPFCSGLPWMAIRKPEPDSHGAQRNLCCALCGGAGSFLISKALAAGADFYITADVKYHEFFDADGRLVIADIGHFESEQFTIDLLFDILREKFLNFAVLKTEIETNPVRYFTGR